MNVTMILQLTEQTNLEDNCSEGTH